MSCYLNIENVIQSHAQSIPNLFPIISFSHFPYFQQDIFEVIFILDTAEAKKHSFSLTFPKHWVNIYARK